MPCFLKMIFRLIKFANALRKKNCSKSIYGLFPEKCCAFVNINII